MKKLSTLETTIDDGILIQEFAMRILDVLPEKIHLLAAEADANLIIKHVRVGGEESKEKQFYDEAKDDDQRKKWQDKPFENVPENFVPMIKASFMF